MHSRSPGEKVFNVFNIMIMMCVFLVTLFPFYYVFIASISNGSAVLTGRVILRPIGITGKAYELIPTIKNFFLCYGNTLYFTIVGGGASMVAMTLGSYALSRKQLKGRKLFNIMIAFTMWFNAGIVPTYLNFISLSLDDTRMGLVLGFLCSAFYIFILRNYFENLPVELEEAARIDGMGDFGIFLRIMLPLAKPVLATVSLYCAIDRWNGYFWASILLKTQEKAPLQVLLKKLIIELNVVRSIDGGGSYDMTRETLIYAIIVVSIVPILAVYPFVQKFFIRGMTLGAVKG